MNKINKNKSTIGDQTGDPTGNLPGWPTCLHPGENYHHPDTHPPAGDPGIANPGPISSIDQYLMIDVIMHHWATTNLIIIYDFFKWDYWYKDKSKYHMRSLISNIAPTQNLGTKEFIKVIVLRKKM